MQFKILEYRRKPDKRILHLSLEPSACFKRGDRLLVMQGQQRKTAIVLDNTGDYLEFYTQYGHIELENDLIDIELRFSPLSSVQGAEKIINRDQGYWPTFHDDYIVKLEHSEDHIRMTILDADSHFANKPKYCVLEFDGLVNVELINWRGSETVWRFENNNWDLNESLGLEDESLTNIVLSIEHEYSYENILMELSSSQGLCGWIICKSVAVSLIPE